MKYPNCVSRSAYSLSLILVLCFGCSGLPESNLVRPETVLQAEAKSVALYDVDNDMPTIAEIERNKDKLHVKILVSECIIQHVSRVYHLVAANPKGIDDDYYNSDRYVIQWYTNDGTMISDSVRLECVAAGMYFVRITDRQTSAYGVARVVL